MAVSPRSSICCMILRIRVLLPVPGVTHNKDVVRFDGDGESDARHNAEQLLQERSFRQFEADAIRTIPAIENVAA